MARDRRAPRCSVSRSSAGAGLVVGALVVAEVLFWVGLALAGKDTWQTIKSRGLATSPT